MNYKKNRMSFKDKLFFDGREKSMKYINVLRQISKEFLERRRVILTAIRTDVFENTKQKLRLGRRNSKWKAVR